MPLFLEEHCFHIVYSLPPIIHICLALSSWYVQGRIVNRISYDTQTIDFVLVTRMNGAFASCFWLLSSIVVMVSVVPAVIVVLLPTCVMYYALQLHYRRACVQLQRLDSTSRSPIQSYLSESLNGVSSIRAYEAQNRFIVRLNVA